MVIYGRLVCDVCALYMGQLYDAVPFCKDVTNRDRSDSFVQCPDCLALRFDNSSAFQLKDCA